MWLKGELKYLIALLWGAHSKFVSVQAFRHWAETCLYFRLLIIIVDVNVAISASIDIITVRWLGNAAFAFRNDTKKIHLHTLRTETGKYQVEAVCLLIFFVQALKQYRLRQSGMTLFTEVFEFTNDEGNSEARGRERLKLSIAKCHASINFRWIWMDQNAVFDFKPSLL